MRLGPENTYGLLLTKNKRFTCGTAAHSSACILGAVGSQLDVSVPYSSAMPVRLYIHRYMCVNVPGPLFSKSWRTYAGP